MFREKINEFINEIDGTEDGECLDLLEDLLESASLYVHRVNMLETANIIGKHTKAGEEYRKYVGSLDKERNENHNAFISNVKVINRLCKKHNLSLFYDGDEEKSTDVANFAEKLVYEIVSTKIIN